MMLDGRVKDGRIVLDRPTELADGARVRVYIGPDRPPTETEASPPLPELAALRARLNRPADGDHAGPTLAERLKDFLAHDLDLPADAASNIDHYLYGQPKRSTP